MLEGSPLSQSSAGISNDHHYRIFWNSHVFSSSQEMQFVFAVFVHSPLSVDLSIRAFMVPGWKRVGAMAIVLRSIEGSRGSQFLTSSQAGWFFYSTSIAAFYFIPPKAPVIYRLLVGLALLV